MNKKLWVTVQVKKEYSRFGIPEMVGIYYNPYDKPVDYIIHLFIAPEFWNHVYGWKHS